MKKQLMSYRVEPMIFLDGKHAKFRIIPRGPHAKFDDGKEYVIGFLPLDETNEGTDRLYDTVLVRPQEGEFHLEYTFHGEQEYFIRVFDKDTFDPELMRERHALLTMSVYCLGEELFNLRPYRGDLHCHTFRSDGRESPEMLAANYRKAGFDFLAVTDHRLYEPSLEAIEAYRDLPVDLKLFPGEEVHSPDNHVHIINFGGSFSVNDIWRNEPERYYAEVAEIQRTLSLPEDINAFEFAASMWVFDKIRQGGGLAVYCHPHWTPTVRHINQHFTDIMFERKPFDAFELLGGHAYIHNNSQTAMYYEYAARGIRVPFVGASDAHDTYDGVSNFREESTVVFAKSNALEDIIGAVKSMNNVAVEWYNGEKPRFHGPFHLVKYMQFLFENYFAIHDEMCFEEGRLMLEARLGDETAVRILSLMQGRTAAYMEHCFWKE